MSAARASSSDLSSPSCSSFFSVARSAADPAPCVLGPECLKPVGFQDLIQRLLEYQQVKAAATVLAGREADWHNVVFVPGLDLQEHARVEEEPIKASLFDLLDAYREALKRLLPPPPVSSPVRRNVNPLRLTCSLAG